MSKLVQGILIAAVLLIVISTIFNSLLVAGGSGIVLLVGLAYAYVVSTRDLIREQMFEAHAENRRVGQDNH